MEANVSHKLGRWGGGERIDSNSAGPFYTRIFLQERDAPDKTAHNSGQELNEVQLIRVKPRHSNENKKADS